MTSLPLTRAANVAFHFSGSLASRVTAGGAKTNDVGLPGRAGEKGLGGARVANHNTVTRPLASTWEPVPRQCGAHGLGIQGQRCPRRTRPATPAGHEPHLAWMLWHLRFPLRRSLLRARAGNVPGATGRRNLRGLTHFLLPVCIVM